MAWVRIDDAFVDHPKIAKVGAIGAWLQIQALCYCNRNLTDGFIPSGIARSFTARGLTRDEDREDGRSVRYTLGEHSGHQGLDLTDRDWPELMVDAGIWEPVDGGYLIHHYTEYQPTKAEVLAERARNAAKAQRHRDRVSNRVTTLVTTLVSDRGPVPVPVPEPSEQKKLAIARKEKATSWPENFTLTAAMRQYAERNGLDAGYEWGKFKAHAAQDDRRHVNWEAAWQYWVRNAWEIAGRQARR